MLDIAPNTATVKKAGDACVSATRQMTSNTRKPLIAIVDHDPAVCRALRRLVRTRQIDAQTFTSGRDFVYALQTGPSFEPECVILELHLQDVDGFELLRQLAA